MQRRKVFIVDSDAIFRDRLVRYLEKVDDIDVFSIASGEECLKFMDSGPHAVIMDYHLDSHYTHTISGLDTLREIQRSYPDTRVIMLSSFDNHDEDMNAARLGAFDYIAKADSNFSRVETTLQNAFRYYVLEEDISMYRNTLFLTLAVLITGGITALGYVVVA